MLRKANEALQMKISTNLKIQKKKNFVKSNRKEKKERNMKLTKQGNTAEKQKDTHSSCPATTEANPQTSQVQQPTDSLYYLHQGPESGFYRSQTRI